MINTKQPSAELRVAFDVTPGQDHHITGQEEEDERLPPILNGDDNMAACRAPDDMHAEVLRLLETLAEQEARDVDFMLAGLALAVVVLLGVYGWTVYTLTRKVRAGKGNRKEPKTTSPCSCSSPCPSTTTVTPIGIADTHRSDTIEHQPPVGSIISRK